MKTKPTIDINLRQVEALAAQGLTQQQIADALGISVSTLDNRKRDNEEFRDAIKRGKAKGIAKVTNKLFEQIQSGNVTATIFFLKTQAGWKEAQVIDHTSSDGSMSPKSALTSEQFQDIKELLKSANDKI